MPNGELVTNRIRANDVRAPIHSNIESECVGSWTLDDCSLGQVKVGVGLLVGSEVLSESRSGSSLNIQPDHSSAVLLLHCCKEVEGRPGNELVVVPSLLCHLGGDDLIPCDCGDRNVAKISYPVVCT